MADQHINAIRKKCISRRRGARGAEGGDKSATSSALTEDWNVPLPTIGGLKRNANMHPTLSLGNWGRILPRTRNPVIIFFRRDDGLRPDPT